MIVCELYRCNDCKAKYLLARSEDEYYTVAECWECGSENIWPVREEEDDANVPV